MARYVVDVMPKREILDPQGKAVLGALAAARLRRRRRRPPGQAVRGRGRRRRRRRPARGGTPDGRDPARQPGDRGLRRHPSTPVTEETPTAGTRAGPRRSSLSRPPASRPRRSRTRREDRGRHLPRVARRRRRRARRTTRGRRGGRAVARRRRPARRRRGRAARRLLLRRLPALRRDLALRAGDDRGRGVGRPGHAGARHLQRLPDPLRVPPAAGCPDPQRPPEVRLPRPAAPDREQPHRRGPGRTPRTPR